MVQVTPSTSFAPSSKALSTVHVVSCAWVTHCSPAGQAGSLGAPQPRYWLTLQTSSWALQFSTGIQKDPPPVGPLTGLPKLHNPLAGLLVSQVPKTQVSATGDCGHWLLVLQTIEVVVEQCPPQSVFTLATAQLRPALALFVAEQ